MSRKDTLFESLWKYYQDEPSRLETFVLYTSRESPVSLRLLDWFVTNYAKKHNTVFKFDNRTCNIFMDYKAQLKAYSKRFFDPFCRRERVTIARSDGDMQETTVGQLNFFKWAISNDVLRYVQDNQESIENDMLCVSKLKESKEAGAKRQELSTAAIKSCTKTYCHFTVRF